MSKDEKNTAIHVAYDETEPYDEVIPEKNLLKAVLLSALSDLRKPGELGRKASEYFNSQDETYIFSFVSVCDHLSIDPHIILTAAGLSKSGLNTSKETDDSQSWD